MANGTDSTTLPVNITWQAVILDIVRKHGVLGVVLIAMMWFIWDHSKYMREDAKTTMQVIAENVKVSTELKAVIGEMGAALRENTVAINKLREERRRIQ